MGLRGDILDYLACVDDDAASDRLDELVARHELEPELRGDDADTAESDASRDHTREADDLTLSNTDRRRINRVRVLDTAPVGITLCGPAYRDTPILYANRTFRALTGYSLETLQGENPRLLQGPRTEPAPVEALREAVSIWEPVTVEVLNHRRDGTPFVNRVSLRPLPGADGTITHWAAVQDTVGEPDDRALREDR